MTIKEKVFRLLLGHISYTLINNWKNPKLLTLKLTGWIKVEMKNYVNKWIQNIAIILLLSWIIIEINHDVK